MKVMTMQQFLQNPSGQGSSVFARRDLIIENLKMRYDKILRESGKKIKLETFKDKSDYFFYFKFPSEKFGVDLLYDVVIQFIPIGNSKTDLTINNYAVKVFSNSPNFMFTYAYIYNKDGIVINFLKEKISDEALNNQPVVKNPTETYGFEKSVYFALLYIKNNRLFTKSFLNTNSKEISTDSLLDDIMSCEDKLHQYNLLKKKISDSKKKVKKVTKNKTTKVNNKNKRRI